MCIRDRNGTHVCQNIAAFDVWMNLSQLAAWLMRAEIPEKLYRNLSLSKFPGFFFEIALEGNASKSSLFRKILRSDSYDQSAVGIFSVSGLIAHAVDCQKPLLRRGIYHIAPRTHTESCLLYTSGSSIELSADGPMKPPYAVYFQGGLTWEHAKLGILMSVQKLLDKHLITLP